MADGAKHILEEPADRKTIDAAFDKVGHTGARGEADRLQERIIFEPRSQDDAITGGDIIDIMIAEEWQTFETGRERSQIVGVESKMVAVGTGFEDTRVEVEMIEFAAGDLG